jgi:hypothetical protein
MTPPPVRAPESSPSPPAPVVSITPIAKPEPVAAQASVAPQVTTSSISLDEDEDDDLPRPGKVWDNSGPSLAELLKQQVKVAVPATPAPAAELAKSPESLANIEPVAIDNLPEVWQKLLHLLGEKSAALPPLLHNAQLVGVEENQAVIRFAHRDAFHARMLDRNGKKDIVRDALCVVVGQTVGLKIDLAPPVEGEDDPPAASPPVRPNPPPRVAKPAAPEPPPIPETPTIRLTTELRDELRQKNPLVDALVRDLGAEIVKVEPAN